MISNAKKSVMIVDDEILLSGTLADILATFGFETNICTSIKKALAEFNKNPTDFVVTDLILPMESGLELVKEIRKNNQKVKIIIMTGADPEDVLAHKGQGPRDYNLTILAKPFAPQDLIDLLT